MSDNLLSFDIEQLNRLFPYFVLLDANLAILQMGNAWKETCSECIGGNIFDHFDSVELQKRSDQPVFGKTITLSPKFAPGLINGNWEKLGVQELFFFAGENYLQDNNSQPTPLDTDDTSDLIADVPQSNLTTSGRYGFDRIVEDMAFGLIEMDVEGKIRYANNSFCRMSGYNSTYFIGKTPALLFKKDFSSEGYLAAAADQTNSELYELEFIDANGNQKLWFASHTLNYNENNENTGWAIICFDVSAYKTSRQELIDAKMDAERMVNIKEMFLTNMSHEIRTPMNAIMSMANQLSKTTLTSEQDYYIQTVQKASKSLLVIINDILDLSKIDAGKLKLENIGFSLLMVLQDVMQVVTHKAQKKGLEINYVPPEHHNIAPVLIGDPNRINQVVLNLMSNAIKFTEKGTVLLTAIILEDHDDGQKIEVLVKDTGIGMDPEFVGRLFDNFSQEYESISRQYGGIGLGMSISQKLVSQMGGYFNVESEKGKGSEISFVIDLKKGINTDLPNEVKPVHNEELFAGRKILIVDDNEMNRLVASTILLSYGSQVMIAESGEAALSMVDESGYDIILMDIQMPILDGYDTTRMLRQGGYLGAIIALTASAVSGERERCIAAGMDDYVSKPINEELLISIIDSWIKKKAGPVTSPILSQPLYNLDGLLTISKGRTDFVTKMIEMFCEQMPGAVMELNSSIQENDLSKVSKLAHKLKSTIDHLGIISLQRTIRQIEILGDENGTSDELLPMIAEVTSVLNLVIEELRQEIKVRNEDVN